MLPILLMIAGVTAAALGVATVLVVRKANNLAQQVTQQAQHIQTQTGKLAECSDEIIATQETIGELRSALHDLSQANERFEQGLALLWSLELARSARTWRQSVAIQPDEVNPFTSTQEPLRLALEVETTALREDVGATVDIEIFGYRDGVLNQLLTLRSAQELLAIAAFEQEPAVFRVTETAENTVLELRSPSDETTLRLTPPAISSPLVEIEKTESLRLTIL